MNFDPKDPSSQKNSKLALPPEIEVLPPKTQTKRRQAIAQLIHALPEQFQAVLKEHYRRAYGGGDKLSQTQKGESGLFEELRRTLNLCTINGLLNRRQFLNLTYLITSAGLLSALFPAAASAGGPMMPFGFWKQRVALASSGYPASTGSDPYWDYVVLLMNFDTPVGSGTTFNTVFADESNFGKTPTIAGSPYIDTTSGTSSPYSGRTGSAFFDGLTSYISFPESSDWEFSNKSFTIESWLQLTNTTTDQSIVGHWLGGAGGRSWRLLWTGTVGKFIFWTSADGIATPSYEFTWTPDQQWHHFALVRSGTSISFYLDGVQLGTSQTINETIYHNISFSLQIGNTANGTGGYFSGRLADLRIYNGAAKYTSNFTPPTSPIGLGTANDKYWGYCVLACPFENTLKDMSGKRVTSSGSAALSTSLKKFGTGATSFNGTDQYLEIPWSDWLTGDMTIEAWIYPTSLGSEKAIFSISEGINVNIHFEARPSGILRLAVINSDPVYNVDISVSNKVTLNTWQHVAAVIQGTQAYLFHNGTLVQTGALTGTRSQTGAKAQIGAYSQGRYFSGQIDSLRITKGYARYTSNFTPPTSAFPVGKDETVDPFWTYTVLAMHMDDLTDSTARHSITNNGSVTNNTSTYKYGTASASFNGSNQYLTTANSTDIAFGTGDFTVECWINPSASSASEYRIWDSRDASYANGFGLAVNTNGLSAISDVEVYSTAPTLGQWTHVAVSRSGSTIRLFKDGALAATGTSSVNASNGTFNIGYANSGAGNRFNGYLDDLRITKGIARYTQNFTPPTRAFATVPVSTATDYDYFYSSVVLLMHMDDANFTDQTGRHTITNNSNVQLSTSAAKFGSSASFNGSTQYLSHSSHQDFIFPGDFTVECWVMLNGANTNYAGIIGQYDQGVGTTGWQLVLDSTGTKIRLEINSVHASGTTSINNGQWNHLAVVRKDSTISGYVNGAPDVAIKTAATTTATNNFYIAAERYGSIKLNGYLDDLRITKGLARYVSNFAPPARAFGNSAGIVTSNLVAYLDSGDNLSTHAPLTTNLITASEQFDNAVWIKEGASITNDSIIAPDGFLSADKLTEDNTNAEHGAKQQYGFFAAGITYTFSIFAKANERSIIRLLLPAAAFTSNHVVSYALVGSGTTSIIAGSPSSVSITLLSNGWYRCNITATATTSTLGSIQLRLIISGTNVIYQGDGTSGLYLWGAQLEASPSAGPYIRTGQNLLQYSEQFDNAAWTKNDSTIAANNAVSPDGNTTADKLIEASDGGSNYHFLAGAATVSLAQTFTLSVYAKAAERSNLTLSMENSGTGNRVNASFALATNTTGVIQNAGNGSGAIAAISSVGGGWYRCTLTGQPDTSGTALVTKIFTNDASLGNSFYQGNGTSGLYLWGAQLEQASSAGSYIKTPISDYIPGSRRIGPPTTNLLTYSDDFSNAAWTKYNGAALATDQIVSPDGLTTADKLTIASSNQYLTQSFTFTGGTTYTYSVYAKAGNSPYLAVLFNPTYANRVGAIFNVSTGALVSAAVPGGGGSTLVSTSISNVGNSWYRCTMTATTGAGSGFVYLGLSTSSGSAPDPFTGTGDIYLWGAQLELGNQPGPYVATTTASATGGGTWNNLVPSPADGSSPAAYDFKYGDGITTTTFPTFNGYAGGRSANDYFSFDGGDYFTLAGYNTTLINSIHKAGALFTLIAIVYFTTTNEQYICGTTYQSSESGFVVSLNQDGNNQDKIGFRIDKAGSNQLFIASDLRVKYSSFNFIGISINEPSGTGVFYLNGSTQNFTSTYSSPSASAATRTLQLASRGNNAAQALQNGTRMGQFLLYNTNLSKAQLDQIFAATRSRFGI